jgi:hypothetical protein
MSIEGPRCNMQDTYVFSAVVRFKASSQGNFALDVRADGVEVNVEAVKVERKKGDQFLLKNIDFVQ